MGQVYSSSLCTYHGAIGSGDTELLIVPEGFTAVIKSIVVTFSGQPPAQIVFSASDSNQIWAAFYEANNNPATWWGMSVHTAGAVLGAQSAAAADFIWVDMNGYLLRDP